MKFAMVIEKAGDNDSAFVPDLPVCVATGSTIPEVEAEIRDAIKFRLEGLAEDGIAAPIARCIVEYVEVR